MGKFLTTRFSGHQRRVIKKSGKSIQRCNTEKDEHNKVKKNKRKPRYLKGQEPPFKKANKSKEETNKVNRELDQIETKTQFQDLEVEFGTNVTSGKECLKLVRQDEDLFSDDELKARYDQFTKFNIIYQIYDEIALEGLDGITIEAFLKRLNIALKFPTCMDCVKDFIWHIICSTEEIMFFELPEPRQDLIIFSRDAYVNKDTNMFMEVYQTGYDIYKVEYAPKGNTWGSCATLTTRVDISEQVRKMSLEDVYATYKNKLVMVADQKLRINALLDDFTDPNYEYTQAEYCILERIGRSRELGEITQGPAALGLCFNMDSKSVYHYCKRFKKEDLVTKQFFCVRSTTDHSKTGRLLHLRRFYTKKKSKFMILTESIINYLKKSPGYRASYNSVKSIFVGPINPKFFKNQEFLKYVNTQVYLPYKELYPEATLKEYMTRNMVKERTVHMMQLKDPYVNIVACWSDSQHPESSDDEDENDEDIKIAKGRTINMEFIREVYLAIHSTGKEGCTTQDVNNMFDVDFPTVRSVLRKLVSRNLVRSKICDMGRQKTNQYVATCFLEHQSKLTNLEFIRSQPTQSGSGSVIERLKEKQKQKFDSLDKERVYSREQFEADLQDNLLGLHKSSLLPVTFGIPELMCDYLNSGLVRSIDKETNLLAEFKAVLKPFKISLTYPELANMAINLRQILPSAKIEQFQISEFKMNFRDFYSSSFKSDYLTKAFLLNAHFGNKINQTEVIEFLNPSIKDKAEKRGLSLNSKSDVSQGTTNQEDGLVDPKKSDLPYYMGSNPLLISVESDEANETLIELFMSAPPKAYKRGNISNYICPLDIATTERVLSRIMLILDTVNSCQVFEEANKLLKLISTKESDEGYDKKIDRKSLHRIINRLIIEGYIKVYYVIISNKSVKKSYNYVCHPEVDHNHEIIRHGIDQVKFKFFCGNKRDMEVIEPVQKKPKQIVERSPFVEHDVLQSIQEINELHPPKHVTLKAVSSKKAGKLYGFRPKFARMSLLHEVLFYLVYVLDKDSEPLPKTEVLELFKKQQIQLTEKDLEELPPVYCKELSWKMFIPPLPRHQGWGDGWALLCDVILRIPLSLLARLYCINFISTELQEILQHPIKRFYLIKNVPSQIQYIVMYRRKYIHDIHFILVRLAYCGVLQFGPSRYKEKDQVFVYVNRKASLLETMTSDPGYHKVSVRDYNSVYFYLTTLEDVTKYWFTMHNICMNTLLNARHVVEGKTITLIDVTAKPSLNKALTVRTPNEVKFHDAGDIPGDHRGAAGLDSALWSHMQKNWFYYAPKSPQSFLNELASLKLDQVMPEQVAFEHLRLPPLANKFYITKPQEVRPIPVRKIKTKRTTKKLPVVKKVMAARKKLPNKREYYDNVDKAILRKYNGVRFRPNWSEEEDKVLILLKVAAAFVTRGTKQIINYVVMRDLLHRALPESWSKTSRTLPRRVKILYRDVPFVAHIETLIHNLYKLVPVAQYFVPLRNFILNEEDTAGKKFKLSEPELHNAFIFMAHYLLNHRKEVETALHGNFTTMDYFNKENLEYTRTKLLPMEEDNPKNYTDPTNLEGIRKYVLKNILQSALGHKIDHPAWSYQMYKIYQKFNQDQLKKTIEELREQHMIQYKKEPLRKFFTPYKFSLNYIFAQITTFTYQTVEESFMALLNLKNTPETLQFTPEVIEDKKYGQMFGLNEVLTFMLNQANLKFWFPEHHIILNPAMEDHSQVIEELAKRYLAKIKNEQKDASIQVDTSYSHILEQRPEPSTSGLEDTEIMQFDDEEPLDLTITSNNSTTITNLKHWISDCIDTERVRSPSPELLNLDVSQEHKKPKENEKKSDEVASLGEKEDRLLSLEEIKTEMLKATSASEKRLVPYISDLVKLLSENFDDTNNDEQTIDEMKKHFVQQYPRLEKLNLEGCKDHFLFGCLENRPIIKEIWRKVERESHVVEPSDESIVFDKILKNGGTIEDVDLASELLTFIYSKEVFGATGQAIKEKFSYANYVCSLDFILKLLTDHNIILRTGVCSLTFVHNNYRGPWLADTFVLTDEYMKLFKKENPRDEVAKLQDIDKRIESTQWISVKCLPWANMDGNLDKDLFKAWLSSVFSYCVENPMTLMTSLFDKFCYIKPVDIFYLVEILQDLGCVEMRRFQPNDFDLFLDYECIQDRKASMLDNFEEIYIEPNQISFNSLGSFFQ